MDKTKESIRDLIKEKIIKERPKLTEASLKTYISYLNTLYKKLNGTDGLAFFTKSKKQIIDAIKEREPNGRKTLLSALFILTGIEEYKHLMLEDCKTVNDKYKQQKMSPEEKENWITTEDIREKYESYLQLVIPMLNNKKAINLTTINDFFILALMSGVAGIPPRRSEYSEMKIKGYDREKDNYYEKDKFVFNKYKTFSTYGRVIINVKEMAPQLNMLIKKWIKINHTDYLLFSSNGNPLTNVQLCQHNNKIWEGKKISCDMYRHIFLSHYYSQPHAYLDMERMAYLCGHSISTAMTKYVKIDAPKDT
jgi:hypothetical protein